jgi:hypothetical protein
MRLVLRSTLRLGKFLLGWLVETVTFPGTNLLGIVLLLSIFLGLEAVFARLPNEGAKDMLMGITCFATDAGLRKALGHESILEFERGGRVLFLPLWIWGVAWMTIGFGRLLWALLASQNCCGGPGPYSKREDHVGGKTRKRYQEPL